MKVECWVSLVCALHSVANQAVLIEFAMPCVCCKLCDILFLTIEKMEQQRLCDAGIGGSGRGPGGILGAGGLPGASVNNTNDTTRTSPWITALQSHTPP